MDAHLTRRAVNDVLSVCRAASPTAAGRWVVSLAVHLPECGRSRSLSRADQSWSRTGARFRTSTRAVVSLPPSHTAGAREMYCRNVYLRTGLTMPTTGWVVDLGANSGLFSVWAALTGAEVIAVEAQEGFAKEIRRLATHNGVADRVHVEIAMASGVARSGATVGVVADDARWAATSHGAAARPADMSMPQLMAAYRIDRVRLLKVDIEGGEFAVLAADEDLGWLHRVDQVVLEVHRDYGNATPLVETLRGRGFTVDLRANDGVKVTAASDRLAYAYCRR
jgi:FkbM family methyltransferase